MIYPLPLIHCAWHIAKRARTRSTTIRDKRTQGGCARYPKRPTMRAMPAPKSRTCPALVVVTFFLLTLNARADETESIRESFARASVARQKLWQQIREKLDVDEDTIYSLPIELS